MYKREIGSEFWNIPLRNDNKSTTLLPPNTAYFLSGRVALDFVIREIKTRRPLRSVSLPSWCCETMITPFLNHGVEVEFYPVYLDEKGYLRQDLPDKLCTDAILVMDYFGYVRQQEIPRYNGIVIRDMTHSIFCGKRYDDADYYFGSLRKWAGFYTGGFAWSKSEAFQTTLLQNTDDQYIALRRQAMCEKEEYLQGERQDKDYLDIFAQAEALLESGAYGAAAYEDIERLVLLDAESIRKQRRANAEQLLKAVSDIAIFPTLKEDDCPLFVPISVTDRKRDALRRYLIEKKIYCPTHWPISPIHKLEPKWRELYDNELSLVCDQRYDCRDMDRLCEALTEFLKR